MRASHLFFKLFVVLSLIFLSISGCVTPKLYSVNMKYDAAQTVLPTYLQEGNGGAVIAVAAFVDKRGIADKKVIGRVVEKSGINVLVFPKYVMATEAATDGVKDYLKKGNYQIADKIERWDLTEEAIPQGVEKILIGGSIDEMEIICRRGFPTNSYAANIKLTIVFADVAQNQVAYIRRVEASSSHEHVSFSEERMSVYMSDLLGEAIRNVFEDKAVAEKIKEIAAR